MKLNIPLFLIMLITILISAHSQNSAPKINLSGIVKDSENGEALIGVTVFVKELRVGIATNAYGYYSMNLPNGEFTVEYSYLGYEFSSQKVKLNSNTVLNIELKSAAKELNEVVVRAERKDANVTRNAMSAQKIEIGAIRKIPALMGEVDLLKVIQLLPGVVSAGEGTSSFSVRGGGIDQNLIILDEATVYNASHLMGFFSVFNNDAIKNITLYKGDIPAVYDGRLASLLEVNMKDGNSKKISGSGGIGTISSRLTLEGPISKDRTSFIVSARRTYADLFLKLSSDPAINKNQLYFYDLNAKLNHKFSENDHLFVSAYMGQDVFKNKNAGFSFGNATFTSRWNHLFSKSLFSNLTLNYSRYTYGLESSFQGESNFLWEYQMRDLGLKYDFTYFPEPDHTFKFGYQSTFHRMSPGSITTTGGSTNYDPYILPDNNALEQAIYYQGEHKLTQNFSLKMGLRLNAFSNIGAGTIYRYDSNYKSVDSTVYGKGDIIKTFFRLAPRIGMNYQLNNQSSVKANYSRTNQFLQMATNSTAGTPLDLWFTAGPNVKPQTCDQFAVGYFRNFHDNEYEASVELFHKSMKNTIDFKDHAQLLLNRKLEGELRFGNSSAYGAEFLLQKKEGRASGWISYTFSHSERKIEGVNDGDTYVAPYDRPHTVYIVASYDLSKRVSIGGNFVYASGQPITYPVARMEVGKVIVPVYSKRNEYRMPDYHRLDVSLTIKQANKSHRPWDGEWNFSIYNVYAHKNPWAINFVGDPDNPNRTKAEMTYLFTFIPSVTYNFKF
ncbi:MAG: TonB-dependent receptor [Bacteroidales bacterium]